MQGEELAQSWAAWGQVQFSARKTRTFSPNGDHLMGEVGPNNAITGTSKAAAKCIGPVSLEMRPRACFSTARNSASLSGGRTFASGKRAFKFLKRVSSRRAWQWLKTRFQPAAIAR